MKSLLLLAVTAAGLVGCSTTGGTRNNPIALGPDPGLPKKNAVLSPGRDGTPRRGTAIALEKNGTLTLKLEAATAAGYEWRLAQPVDANVLQRVSPKEFSLPPIALPPAGPHRPTEQEWVFKAKGPGVTKVRMIYGRPDQPLNELVRYDFLVRTE